MIETIAGRTSDGVTVGARCAGDEGRALVFVHGVGSTAAIWDTQLRAFGDHCRCVAVELRGNGVLKPEPEPGAITREGFANDVLALADAEGMETFTLVGCSLGGVVGFELWKRARKRIDAMMIVGSFARYPDGQAYADAIAESVRAGGDMTAFAMQRAARLALPAARMQETIEQMGRKSVASYLASTQATWTGDYTGILSSIDVPVLVACGEYDRIAPLALSQEIADGIPGAELRVIADAGHVANADEPERFNELLQEFLDSAAVV